MVFSFHLFIAHVDKGVVLVRGPARDPHFGPIEQTLLSTCLEVRTGFSIQQVDIVRGLTQTLIRSRLRLISDSELSRVLWLLDSHWVISRTFTWVDDGEQTPLTDIVVEIENIFRTAAERDSWTFEM